MPNAVSTEWYDVFRNIKPLSKQEWDRLNQLNEESHSFYSVFDYIHRLYKHLIIKTLPCNYLHELPGGFMDNGIFSRETFGIHAPAVSRIVKDSLNDVYPMVNCLKGLNLRCCYLYDGLEATNPALMDDGTNLSFGLVIDASNRNYKVSGFTNFEAILVCLAHKILISRDECIRSLALYKPTGFALNAHGPAVPFVKFDIKYSAKETIISCKSMTEP